MSTFTLIGATASALYVVIATALTELNLLHAVWASALTYAAIIPLAYIAQKHLTFRSKAAHTSAFPKYLTIQTIGLAITTFGTSVLSHTLLPSVIIFAAVAALNAILSFVLNDKWSFKHPQTRQGHTQ